jgi:hypothetical protein
MTGRKPKHHGGARKGSGRKPLNGAAGERYQVHLTAEVAALLRTLGDGSLSQGITNAARIVWR